MPDWLRNGTAAFVSKTDATVPSPLLTAPRNKTLAEDNYSVAEWIHFIYTFWDSITHYKAKSVHFWGLMNSAIKTDTPEVRPEADNSQKFTKPFIILQFAARQPGLDFSLTHPESVPKLWNIL